MSKFIMLREIEMPGFQVKNSFLVLINTSSICCVKEERLMEGYEKRVTKVYFIDNNISPMVVLEPLEEIYKSINE